MQHQVEQQRLPIFKSLANGIPVPRVEEQRLPIFKSLANGIPVLQFQETGETRRQKIIDEILVLLRSLNIHENIAQRKRVDRLYFVELDTIGHEILFDKHGIKENSRGILVGGGKRIAKSKSKSKSKKRIYKVY